MVIFMRALSGACDTREDIKILLLLIDLYRFCLKHASVLVLCTLFGLSMTILCETVTISYNMIAYEGEI